MRTIILNEDVASEVARDMEMTEWKFTNGLKHFLAGLMDDPVNTKPDEVFSFHGLDRIGLLKQLLDRKMVRRVQRLCDKDEDGKPKTATMKVKFMVPKKDFDRNIRRMYMELFDGGVDECTACGGATGCQGNTDGSNSVIQPMTSKVIRRKIAESDMQEATAGGATNSTVTNNDDGTIFGSGFWKSGFFADAENTEPGFSVETAK